MSILFHMQNRALSDNRYETGDPPRSEGVGIPQRLTFPISWQCERARTRGAKRRASMKSIAGELATTKAEGLGTPQSVAG
ncbi:MAG: hypothetical protein QOJ99_370 [Bryobacterales bacterium]|nr:hypothetical protein [Bryobacterales bacterium]